MKSRLYSLCGRIVSPITENPVFFTVSLILLVLPPIIRDYSDLRYWVMAIPVCLAWAYILCAMLYLSKSTFLRTVFYLILFCVTIAEVFIILSFGTRISALIIRLILETNPEEASGFFSQYVAPYVLYISAGIGLACFAIYFLEKCINDFRKRPIRGRGIIPVACILIFFCAINVYRDIRGILLLKNNNNIATIFSKRMDYTYGGIYTSYGLIIDALYSYSITSRDIDELAQTLQQPMTIYPTYKSCHVCMIIGESFNKHHASIYNYHLNTTPKLQQEVEEGRLYVFNDVVTPINATIEAMQLFSSFSNRDNDIKWSKTPLIPVLYKRSGYYCSFISNSEVNSSEDSVWDTKNNYWVSHKTVPLMFDAQNTHKYKYDIDLLKDLERINPIATSYSFTMLHLLGQHSDYVDRYPEEFTFFTSVDYLDTTLRPNQKEGIAHYDNATLFNDWVVYKVMNYYKHDNAIIVYFSDHGEEIYDYRDFVGRSFEPIITPERAKYQFEVPFMIWMSDKYKENHPEVVAQVERSVHRPYMIDDLPHLMLDLAGIECEWFDPTRSIINDQFNTKRKRLLLDSKQDYDEIMKGAK